MWTFLLLLPLIEATGLGRDFDPCKRQSFRATCASDKSKGLRRSQFVLRYYQRGNDCVSYPYGRCPGDPVGDHLFRYKKECEDYCLNQSRRNRTEAVERTQSQTTTEPYWTQIERQDLTTNSATIPLGNSVLDRGTIKRIGEGRATFPPPVISGNERKTKCQRQRSRATKSGVGFTPLCTLGGEYMPVQCDNGTRFCWCVNQHGHELPMTRTGRFPPRCKSSHAFASSEEWLEAIETAANVTEIDVIVDIIVTNGTNVTGLTVSATDPPSSPTSFSSDVSAEKLATLHLPKDIRFSPKTSSTKARSVCSQPKNRGTCDKFELRFYFSQETRKCKYFFYGGCEGNENNFKSLEDCQTTCERSESASNVRRKPATNEPGGTTSFSMTDLKISKPETVCEHPVDVGPCRSTFRRWFYNSTTNSCHQFDYGGCQGNGNNFPSLSSCVRQCFKQNSNEQRDLPDDICQHPKDAGDCDNAVPRFYFDPVTRRCDNFIYSGCRGNGNNFATAGDCENSCLSGNLP